MQSERPDKPLVVKCGFDRSLRRITFASARNCSFPLLRIRVEQCFALSASTFTISYLDDDGESTDINSEHDLTEAIQYFQAGAEDHAGASSGSAYSGYSGRVSRKITLRITVAVEYDGPSLSDTSSLVSMEDYPKRAGRPPSLGGSDSLSLGSYEIEDDMVTVSSRDTPAITPQKNRRRPLSIPRGFPNPFSKPSLTNRELLKPSPTLLPPVNGHPSVSSSPSRAHIDLESLDDLSVADPPPLPRRPSETTVHDNNAPSLVFERLRLVDPQSVQGLHSNERGVQWLRDQNDIAIRHMMGVLPEPSEAADTDEASSLGFSVREEIHGELALEQDTRGRYYYSYTSDTSSHTEGDESALSHAEFVQLRPEEEAPHNFEELPVAGPSAPRTRDSLLTQQTEAVVSTSIAASDPFDDHYHTSSPDLSPELLQAILQSEMHSGPTLVTECSSCGDILDSFRYVCSTCGEKKPRTRDEVMLEKSERNRPETDAFGADAVRGLFGSTTFYDEAPSYADEDPFENAVGASTSTLANSPHTRPHSHTLSNGWSKMLRGAGITSASRDDYPLALFSHTRSDDKPLPRLPFEGGLPSLPPHVLVGSSSRDGDAPDSPAGSSATTSTGSSTAVEHGYELCPKCLATNGVVHAESVLSGSIGHSSSFSSSPGGSMTMINGHVPSPPIGIPSFNSSLTFNESPPTISPHVSKKPKRKGQIRHAYIEKVWGIGGWTDVELDDDCSCSICNKGIDRDRFKCVSCEQFNLCRACYSQVHEIHPSHAFLAIPDKSLAVDIPASINNNNNEEPSLKHPGVRCSHCMQDIVGARFHCALCESVDICSNCESVGLPGNLTSPDGGHDSSHIMIKIPVPLETNEVQTASRQARALLMGRDAPVLGATRPARSRANSIGSEYQQTVVGVQHSRGHNSRNGSMDLDHHILCRACNRSIVGTRYQCASCPSIPSCYSLCADCEKISFTIHDAMHIFIKITKPVDRPIESPLPLIAPVYDIPAGHDRDGNRYGEDFNDYLTQYVVHSAAICDRCIEPIRGVWFRCANCDEDLCEDCEQVGVHDSRHVLLVFKSSVNMYKFRHAVDLDNAQRKKGVLSHLVHAS